MRLKLLSIIVVIPILTSAADDPLVGLFEAAGEYIAVGYQLTYIHRNRCAKYPFGGSGNAYDLAKTQVQERIRGEDFSGLLEALRPAEQQLKAEADAVVGEVTPFNCGKAKGQYDAVLGRSRDAWLRAIHSFDAWRQANP